MHVPVPRTYGSCSQIKIFIFPPAFANLFQSWNKYFRSKMAEMYFQMIRQQDLICRVVGGIHTEECFIQDCDLCGIKSSSGVLSNDFAVDEDDDI